VARRVLLATADLVFRSKLGQAVTTAGGEVIREGERCDLAVVAVETSGALQRIQAWVAGGVPVLAYGPHVRADLLRAAREAGATAVPNSEVERRLLELLTSR